MTAEVIGWLAAGGAKADADADSKARVEAMATDFMAYRVRVLKLVCGEFGEHFGGLKTIRLKSFPSGLPSPLFKAKISLHTMTKLAVATTIIATMLSSSSSNTVVAFAPPSPMLSSTSTTSSALHEFANGLVGGEGPEPMPFNFAGDKTAKNFDPIGFAEVRDDEN